MLPRPSFFLESRFTPLSFLPSTATPSTEDRSWTDLCTRIAHRQSSDRRWTSIQTVTATTTILYLARPHYSRKSRKSSEGHESNIFTDPPHLHLPSAFPPSSSSSRLVHSIHCEESLSRSHTSCPSVAAFSATACVRADIRLATFSGRNSSMTSSNCWHFSAEAAER